MSAYIFCSHQIIASKSRAIFWWFTTHHLSSCVVTKAWQHTEERQRGLFCVSWSFQNRWRALWSLDQSYSFISLWMQANINKFKESFQGQFCIPQSSPAITWDSDFVHFALARTCLYQTFTQCVVGYEHGHLPVTVLLKFPPGLWRQCGFFSTHCQCGSHSLLISSVKKPTGAPVSGISDI